MADLKDIVSLAKRRGFVFPGSEIYGGLTNTYDYGPLGVELLRHIQNHWWDYFVTKRDDMFGLDSSILMSPKVWEASGHTASFTDVMVDCLECKIRTRADHLIEDKLGKPVEGLSPQELQKIIETKKIPCPNCGKSKWTAPRKFNLLFQTSVGILPETQSLAYLRGEIAQGMFVNFKNVLDTMRPRLPFGLAQSGKAFRNEITMGNFIFRNLEFYLSEFEYFFDQNTTDWQKLFEVWKETMWSFALSLGLSAKNLRWRAHTDAERSHYSSRTEDLDYHYPFGFKEMFGIAYRTDFDLQNHTQKSGVDLSYTDPHDPTNKFIPHVIEPTFGINRVFLAVLSESFVQEEKRIVLKLPTKFAPYTVAIFPLLANKPELTAVAKSLYDTLKQTFRTKWDDRGNIGKRYFAQDEIGTPYCITVDFDSLTDSAVTVRDRDTMKQERVSIAKLIKYLHNKLT